MLQSVLFDVMFLNRYGGDGATTDTRMDQRSSQLVYQSLTVFPYTNVMNRYVYSLAMNLVVVM